MHLLLKMYQSKCMFETLLVKQLYITISVICCCFTAHWYGYNINQSSKLIGNHRRSSIYKAFDWLHQHELVSALYQTRNNWLFSPGDSHTEVLLVLPHPVHEGEVDTDSKGRFVTFKVTLSNDKFLCVYDPSGHSTRYQLVRERFFEGLQTYNMENKWG